MISRLAQSSVSEFGTAFNGGVLNNLIEYVDGADIIYLSITTNN